MHCIKEAAKAQNIGQADSNIAVTSRDHTAEQKTTTPWEARQEA